MDNFNSTLESLKNMSYETGLGNNTTFTHDYMEMNIIYSLIYVEHVIDIVTICIELPVICWAVFALYHQVKADNVTPVYVINLLISDFIQIIGRIISCMYSQNDVEHNACFLLFLFGLVASILFMVCIALERYLLVVHPLWYRCHHTIKHSILLSLAVYVSDLPLFVAGYFSSFSLYAALLHTGCMSFLFLLPLPLFVFFLGATWRALSNSISVPHKEKKRILGTLALVLLIYFVLFFPFIFVLLYWTTKVSGSCYICEKIRLVAFMFLDISPLIDALLYILIKKDARYTRKVPQCCRRLCTHKESRETSTVPTENVTSV